MRSTHKKYERKSEHGTEIANERTNERTSIKAHLLFEQSGTFKKAFEKYGIHAEDYDIQNDFGETDHQIDLFQEIRKAYKDEPSIFDDISQDDIVIAFFPCIRFENQVMLFFRGQAKQMKKWTDVQKMENCMKLQDELTEMYKLVNMLFITCMRKKIRLIMENPFSEEHYLRRYWCIKPAVIDRNRQLRGDYFCKPTQYWFVNCEPQYNFEWFEQTDKETYNIENAHIFASKLGKNRAVVRSMIAPEYAERFIREFILDKESQNEESKRD